VFKRHQNEIHEDLYLLLRTRGQEPQNYSLPYSDARSSSGTCTSPPLHFAVKKSVFEKGCLETVRVSIWKNKRNKPANNQQVAFKGLTSAHKVLHYCHNQISCPPQWTTFRWSSCTREAISTNRPFPSYSEPQLGRSKKRAGDRRDLVKKKERLLNPLVARPRLPAIVPTDWEPATG